MDRREFIGTLMAGYLSGLLVKRDPIDGLSSIVSWVKNQNAFFQRKIALNHIVDLDKPVQIYAGKNQLAIAAGKKNGLSPYLENAGFSFSNLVSTNLKGKVSFETLPPTHDRLIIDKEKELILLGGPVANSLGGLILGYDYDKLDDGTRFPKFESNELRWGFYCGDIMYGGYGGKIEKAKRFEGGMLVDRPLYAIHDKTVSDIIRFKRDSDGFLQNEVLLVTKKPNPYNEDYSVFVIGGMHGYSIDEFSSNIYANIYKLKDKIQRHRSYQIYIPVNLTHDKDMDYKITKAFLDWEKLQFEAFD